MAHVILGLLLIVPQSLYDLLKAFEAGISLFYSASTGSIKRALDGLLERGDITVARIEGARGRKVYEVTDAGRETFRTWMLAEPAGPDLESTVLPRLHFLGLLPATDRPQVLRQITARVEAGLAQMQALERQIADAEIPDHQRDIAHYQRATLDYGLGSFRHAVEFFQTLEQTETPQSGAPAGCST